MSKEFVLVSDLGLIPYTEAWAHQTELHKALIAKKRNPEEKDLPVRHHFLLCSHPPVYTLGKSGKKEHLLLNEQGLADEGVEFFEINRGGDITYHGPGQIIGYPIFDMDRFFCDVHRYVRYLEEAVIRMLAEFGIRGEREHGFTGVWIAATDVLPKRKICAIGVHMSRWVTLHGFALNVNTDLKYFRNIVPCGIGATDMDVTSMAREIGQEVDTAEVKTKLINHFSQIFNFHHDYGGSTITGTQSQNDSRLQNHDDRIGHAE